MENPVKADALGTIISNPHGERLESEPALIALHSQLGRIVKARFPGWRLSILVLLLSYLAVCNCVQSVNLKLRMVL